MFVEMAMSRGEAFLRAEQWDEALLAFEDAIRHCSDDSLGRAARADASRSAGVACGHLRRWERSSAHLRASFELAQALNDEWRTGMALNAHAVCAFERGSWKLAENLFTSAREHACKARDNRLLAEIDNNEGALWTSAGLPQRAEICLRRALAHFERLDRNPNTARVLNNLGVALAAQERWWDARSVFVRATRACRRTGDCALIARVMLNRADLAYERTDVHQAELLATRAIAFSERSGDLVVESGAVKCLAAVARSNRRFETARRYARRAVFLARRARSPLAEARALVEFGHVLSSTETHDELAVEAWGRARALFRKLGNEGQASRLDDLLLSRAARSDRLIALPEPNGVMWKRGRRTTDVVTNRRRRSARSRVDVR